jgi:hypothetical protein
VIKQFNFYDIYGYLLPGVAFLGLLWLPIGIASRSWPEQDISKALFLAALSYFAGHILQTIASVAVPSQVMRDTAKRPRFPSDRLLDKTFPNFGTDLKVKLASQVQSKFGIDLRLAEDGDGTAEVSRNRNTAFFQARSYLIAQKTAHYVEQFQGLYAMMRGLSAAFLAGTFYLAGWSFACHGSHIWMQRMFAAFAILGTVTGIVSSCIALSRNSTRSKMATVILSGSLLVAFLGIGFWVAISQPSDFWKHALPHSEPTLWFCAGLTIIAAARCFSSYQSFAIQFAQSVWRDFSVYITLQDVSGPEGDGESEKNED